MYKQQIINLTVILIIGTFILWFIFFAFRWLFQELNENVAAAIISASLGLIGLWYAQWQSKIRDIAESHRVSKIEVYNVFFDLVEKFQKEDVGSYGEENISESLKKDFQKLNRGLLLWASPGVITAYLNFRKASTGGGDILTAVDAMYREIRKDLGNSNSQLKPGDLIRIGLKHPNELK